MFEGGGRGEDFSAVDRFESSVEDRAEIDPRVSVEKSIRDMLENNRKGLDFKNEEFEERRIEIKGKIESQEAHTALGELMSDFEKRHDSAELNVDPFSPESRIEYLLSLLVECGSDWYPQKRQAVRKIVYNYIDQIKAKIKNTKLMTALDTQLLVDDWQKDFGELKPEEQDLINSWLQK